MRRLHRDLGAGNYQISHVDRQFRQQHTERIEDRNRDDAHHCQNDRRRNRDPQRPHHPAMARRSRKARLQSGEIGWVMYRVHRGSRARNGPIIVPGIAGLCSPDLLYQCDRNGAEMTL